MRAPLNSRVSYAPPPSKGKGKAARQDTLDGVSVEIQEAMILEDLLYILMVRRSTIDCFASDWQVGHRRDLHHTSPRLLSGGRRSSSWNPIRRVVLVGCIPTRSGGEGLTSWNVLHCYIILHRAEEPSRVWARESCSVRRYS